MGYYQWQLFILSEHTDGLSPAKSLCQIDAPYSAPLFTRIFKSILNPAYDRTIPFRFIPDTILLPLWIFNQIKLAGNKKNGQNLGRCSSQVSFECVFFSLCVSPKLKDNTTLGHCK